MSTRKLSLSVLHNDIDTLKKRVDTLGKGLKGDSGATGQKGEKGDKGDPGESGNLGLVTVDNTSRDYVVPLDGMLVFNVDTQLLEVCFNRKWYAVQLLPSS